MNTFRVLFLVALSSKFRLIKITCGDGAESNGDASIGSTFTTSTQTTIETTSSKCMCTDY